jgi:hypothetical protein
VTGPRRLWPLWLLVCFPLVHADDTSEAAKKPAASATTKATKPSAPSADEELLEFLGSVDEESDAEWIDYLSKADISKAAKAQNKAPAATEASSK